MRVPGVYLPARKKLQLKRAWVIFIAAPMLSPFAERVYRKGGSGHEVRDAQPFPAGPAKYARPIFRCLCGLYPTVNIATDG